MLSGDVIDMELFVAGTLGSGWASVGRLKEREREKRQRERELTFLFLFYLFHHFLVEKG